ncbi:hypothetical protein [Butyrivibrio sp. MB2005]|uniref:hypothetical protein n=1 Tax=Butyrivibrio sp. MB2005 TaxID=1280678 RepID=UPI00041F55BD|nr:hypothetical protein [Butyrivibrio sp. MB2005]
MLDKDIIVASTHKEFADNVKEYFVNMEKNIRTLHRTNGCQWAKGAYKFITFSSLDEVEKYEIEHKDATPFRRCGNCFKRR